MQNKWIEIAGLPGVGKTTLIEKYRPELEKKFTIVESRNPTIWQRVIAKMFLHGWIRWVVHDYALAQSLAYRLSFRTLARDKNVLFYDSGLIQWILENDIAKNIDDYAALQKITCGSLPSTLIYINDLESSVLDRELGRSPRRFAYDREDLEKRYKASEEMLKTRVFPLIERVHIVHIHDEKHFLETLGV